MQRVSCGGRTGASLAYTTLRQQSIWKNIVRKMMVWPVVWMWVVDGWMDEGMNE